MPGTLKQNNFIWLTIALVGIIVAGALSRSMPDHSAIDIIEYSSVILMLLSLLSLQELKRPFHLLFALVVMVILSIATKAYTGIEALNLSYLLFVLVFMLSAAWIVGRSVLLTGSVDVNKMVGSIALYLLLGIIWSLLYTLVLEFWPDAFNGVTAGPWYENMPTMTYFSFVTLTTLGYGDITPNQPVSEMLVILEAVTGMFYLAIIVASMVGAMRERSVTR